MPAWSTMPMTSLSAADRQRAGSTGDDAGVDDAAWANGEQTKTRLARTRRTSTSSAIPSVGSTARTGHLTSARARPGKPFGACSNGFTTRRRHTNMPKAQNCGWPLSVGCSGDGLHTSTRAGSADLQSRALVCATASSTLVGETKRTSGHFSGRVGSPSVVDSRRPRRSSNSVGSARVSAGRPPPERRTFEPARSGAAKSFKPRSIVLRAIPVDRATALTPPYPAERASAAANKRRSRSSRRCASPRNGRESLLHQSCRRDSHQQQTGESQPRRPPQLSPYPGRIQLFRGVA